MEPSSALLRALDNRPDGGEALLLRVGLGISLAVVAVALAGIEVLDRGTQNLLGVILGGIGAAWFLFRITTARFAWSAWIGRNLGWCLLAALPPAFVAAEGLETDITVAASWFPPQVIAVLIAFSMIRLRPALPSMVAVASAVYLIAAFIFIRTHVPLEVAISPELRWSVGLFRAGTILLWGALASFLVVGIRRAIARAGSDARADDLLGKYRLGAPLGKGGMGEVRRATYCPEGGFVSEVAIKRVHPHLAQDPRVVDRFRGEAEVGARLRHHNIVATLDFGRMDETYFLAMEYVDGESLRRLMRRAQRAKASVPEAVVGYIGHEILNGLDFAHEVARCPEGKRLRVVHRDLCPNNVLVSGSGHVKIADFGVAHALRDAACFEPTQVVGKIGYVSPEAIRGDSLDVRADLFAAGCVLWELMTGEKPFEGEDTLRSLRAVVDCDLVAANGRAWLDTRWTQFFDRALSRLPHERFSSAREMLEALQDLVPLPATAEDFARWMGGLGQRPWVSLACAPSSRTSGSSPPASSATDGSSASSDVTEPIAA
jgi:serine/threonine-protein kinase